MRFFLSALFILVISAMCFSQKTVADLRPAHAVALEKFLSKNKDYKFLSEKSIGAKYLKFMREGFGKSLTPYHRVADFNRDKILDFALILSKKGEPVDQGEGFSEDHRYLHKLAVVIFNGKKKRGFTQSFIEDIEAPLVCFFKFNKREKEETVFWCLRNGRSVMMTLSAKDTSLSISMNRNYK